MAHTHCAGLTKQQLRQCKHRRHYAIFTGESWNTEGSEAPQDELGDQFELQRSL